MKRDYLYKIIQIILLSVFLLFQFKLPVFAWSGTIRDKETGQPIENAVIVRSWSKSHGPPGLSYEKLEAYKETISDRNGKFNIIGRLPSLFVGENKPVIFKPGYKFLVVSKKSSIIKLENIPATYYLRYEEVKKARGNYEIDFHQTKLLKRIVEDEERFINSLNKYVPGVWITGFVSPRDITIDQGDNVFVADGYFRKIYKLAQKEKQARIRQGGSGGWIDIEIDQSGNLYKLTDGNLHRISINARSYGDMWSATVKSKPIEKSARVRISHGGTGVWTDKSGNLYNKQPERKIKRTPIDYRPYGEKRFALLKSNKIFLIVVNKPHLLSYDLEGNLLCKQKVSNKNSTQREGNIQLIDIDSGPDDSIFVVYSYPNSYRDENRNRYVIRNGILIFDQNCNETFYKEIDIDTKVRSIEAIESGIVVADRNNIYIYDQNVNLIFKKKVWDKELGEVDIRRISSDKSGTYLYLIENRYSRILKYNLKTRKFCIR